MHHEINECPVPTPTRLGECATEAKCDLAYDRARQTIRVAVEVAASYNFSDALHALKSGHRITRKGWNAGGMWLAAQYPDKGSKMSRAYIYMKTVDNELVPWVASQTDLLASDWAILPIQPL